MVETSEVYQKLRNKTAPGLLREKALTDPGAVAYRVKKLGIYQERTWDQFYNAVSSCALGLAELGFTNGDRIALMGDPCEEYAICDLAAQSLGAISFGIYPTSSKKEVQYLMEDGGACIFVAENQEYVDKILPLFDSLEKLKWVIVIGTEAMFMYVHPSLVTYEDLIKRGRTIHNKDPRLYEKKLQTVKPTDAAFIVYTSGTTGNPKGVLISHGKHLAAVYSVIDLYPVLSSMQHRTVVYLPLCHVLGRVTAITLPLLTPMIPHYGENIEDLPLTLFETGPTFLYLVPRYLQKFASTIVVAIKDSTPLKKLIYRIALKISRKHLRNVWNHESSIALRMAYFMCYHLVFRPILNKIGFSHLKLATCAGAPLPPEVMALWQMYGVNLSESYGQTEMGGALVSAQGSYFPRPGNVGVPPAGFEVKLSASGEILVRGNYIFEGYYGRPDATSEVIDADGWLHTGDVGEWTEDGNLKIVDRARDIIVTAGGKTLSPTYVENALRSSIYINEAVVFGHSRKYLTALIEIDLETVADWARSNNIFYTGYTSLVQNTEIIKLIGTEIAQANQEIARVEQVKQFRIIPRELDPETDGEPITPTRKVKRELMYERFKDLVESMYSHEEERLLVREIGDLLT